MAGPISIVGIGHGGEVLLVVQMDTGDRDMAERYYRDGRMMVWMAMQKVPIYRVVVRPKLLLLENPNFTIIHDAPERQQ